LPISYYLFDGDRVGQRIDELLITSGDAEVGAFSKRLEAAVGRLAAALQQVCCTVVYVGGDSILARGTLSDPQIREMLERFQVETGVTISVGIGVSKAESILGVRLAKARGGGTYAKL
jgi:GTP cyclohydrolase III